jgi:hypothetical protein
VALRIKERNERPDERLVAQFRAAPLSLTQAIAVADTLRLSREVTVARDVISVEVDGLVRPELDFPASTESCRSPLLGSAGQQLQT